MSIFLADSIYDKDINLINSHHMHFVRIDYQARLILPFHGGRKWYDISYFIIGNEFYHSHSPSTFLTCAIYIYIFLENKFLGKAYCWNEKKPIYAVD